MGERKKTRQILVGKVKMGGGAPVTIQSMLNTPAEDFAASVEQAKRLEAAGCEIIRAAIPNLQSVPLIEHLKRRSACRLWRTSTSTTGWRWKRWRPAWTRCESTPATSATRTGCARWCSAASFTMSPSAWGQLRQPGKAHPGKVRPPHRAGDGGQRAVPRLAD